MEFVENNFYDIITYLKAEPSKPKKKSHWIRAQYRNGAFYDRNGGSVPVTNPADVLDVIVDQYHGEMVTPNELQYGRWYTLLPHASFDRMTSSSIHLRGVGIYIGDGRFVTKLSITQVEPIMYIPGDIEINDIPSRYHQFHWMSVLHMGDWAMEYDHLMGRLAEYECDDPKPVVFEVIDDIPVMLADFSVNGSWGITHVGFLTEADKMQFQLSCM